MHTLGYLRDTDRILDPTYGTGRWWKTWRPVDFIRSDFGTGDDVGVMRWDFTALPLAARSVDACTFDPPYKLNGTPSGGGPANADACYGVGDYRRWQDRHALIVVGITECARVTNRHLVVKCQDQVSSGAVHWQTRIFADHAETCGFRLVDRLLVSGYREQPEGRTQRHAANDYSTALIFKRKGR